MATQRPDAGLRHPLLQPGAGDEAGRDRPTRSPPATTRSRRRRRRSPSSAARTPSTVEDRAGFIVNALLFPYLNNAMRMWENGTASMEAIDTAMRAAAGSRWDRSRCSTSSASTPRSRSSTRSTTSSATPTTPPMPTLRRKVAAGQLGRKSGHGFFDVRVTRSPRRRAGARACQDGAVSERASARSLDRLPPAPSSPRSSRHRAAGRCRPTARSTTATSSPSAPTSNRARCSPPTAPGCSRCRSIGDGSPGSRRTRGASSRSTGCTSSRSLRRSVPRFERRDGHRVPMR